MYIHIYKDINGHFMGISYFMGIFNGNKARLYIYIYIFNEIIGCKENMMSYTMIRLIFTL